MSHSMYTNTQSGNKAMITAWGPNWHDQVPYTIYIFFMQCHCGVCVCVCVYVRWEYIHTYVVLYIYTRSMHIIEKLPLVLLGITSYPFSNLKQFWGWGRVKDWKSSRFRPSPVCRSRSRSHAVIGPHCVRTLASSQNHSLDTSTQTLAQQHRRPSV